MKNKSDKSFFDFNVKAANGSDYPLSKHKEQVTLVVNVASKCGYTGQYAGLQELYTKFKDQGFNIIGFPCNQFGAQEPGTESEIQQFCSLNYNVTFPIMSKINVNGSDAAEIYKFLKSEAPGILGTEAIKWNFTKFLVDKHGQVLKRYAPTDEPMTIADDVLAAIKK